MVDLLVGELLRRAEQAVASVANDYVWTRAAIVTVINLRLALPSQLGTAAIRQPPWKAADKGHAAAQRATNRTKSQFATQPKIGRLCCTRGLNGSSAKYVPAK